MALLDPIKPKLLSVQVIPRVSRAMAADFRFADGRTGHMTCSLFSVTLLRASALVKGDAGRLSVVNPIAPQFFHRLSVQTSAGTRSERLRSDPTYTHQLRAFVAAVREGAAVPTGPDDAIANMRVIDAVYTHAGLAVRGAL